VIDCKSVNQPTRRELIRLLARAQGHMFELAANLSVDTPRGVVERHNLFSKEVGELLESEAPATRHDLSNVTE
jgi:hypothetical protein